MTTKHLRYVSLWLLVTTAFASCTRTQEYFSNPEEQLVHELADRRVLMIGDFYHEIALPMHGLTSFLSTWVTMIALGESDQRHLTLFLEEDKSTGNLILGYLRTGDLRPFLDFMLPNTSLERLEFYADLRRISLRIDSLNSVLPPERQITFDLQGPEEMSVLDPRSLDVAEAEANQYVLSDRDSITAMNVISYLKNHPLQSALIYYGSKHLIKVKNVPKNIGKPSLPHGNGDFLASYLKEEYGDKAVLSVSQLPESRARLNMQNYGGNNVLFYSDNVPWKFSPETFELMRSDYFDAFVVRNEVMCAVHPLRTIYSKAIIAASIRRLELLQAHLAGYFSKRLYDQSLQTLRFLADSDITTIAEWKHWQSNSKFDAYQIFRGTSFRREVMRYLTENPKEGESSKILSSLGFSDSVANRSAMPAQECNQLFDRVLPDIIFLNSIGISWIGYPNEQVKAKQYLVEYSGQSYDNPDQYLKWWRKKFYNASY